MNDTNITDYGVFSNAVSSTKAYGTKIDAAEEEKESVRTTLSNGEVILGPFQDECLKELSKLNDDFSTMKSTFSTISNFLTDTSNTYQITDEKAASVAKDSTVDTNGLSTDIAAKKKAFLGDVDDPNNYDEPKKNYRSMRKQMTLFDNTTGEILHDREKITMKPGETRVITVKLPTDTGMINEIHRTTADGGSAYRSKKYITAESDIDPDPNNSEWVRQSSNHWPENRSLLHNNHYEWVITARADGTVQASQTCEYTTDVSRGENLKAMINLFVEVKS